ncbi:AraC family transcriptional regulator [Streptomyces sp. NPDC002172]
MHASDSTTTRHYEPEAPRADDSGWPEHHQVDFGPVRLSLLRPPGLPAMSALGRRPAADGPATWYLVHAACGALEVRVEGTVVRLEPGHMVLAGPSESAELSAVGGRQARAAALHLPESALPLPGEVLRVMNGRPAPTRSGPAALLTSFLEGLAAQAPLVETAHTAWLGNAAISLTNAFLGSESGSPPSGTAASHPPGPATSRTNALVTEIKRYIERRLADPDLSPPSIARAHHISLRYLHHVFQQEQRHTVGGFLRERRLEHCRRDLAEPSLSGRSVCEIGSRWGFRDPAVFNRTFKSAYGVTPGAYRRLRLRG